MARQIIAIDIDDVLADTHGTTQQWARDISGVDLGAAAYSVKDDYWGYYARIWEAHDLQDALTHDAFEESIAADEVRIPLLAGASLAINELRKRYEVILITSRNTILEETTRRWVREHFDDTVQIYFAHNQRSMTGTQSKGELCIEHGASFLIDDSVGHCVNALEHGITPLLFGDYGWQHTIPDGIVRCRDWSAVLEYFDAR